MNFCNESGDFSLIVLSVIMAKSGDSWLQQRTLTQFYCLGKCKIAREINLKGYQEALFTDCYLLDMEGEKLYNFQV